MDFGWKFCGAAKWCSFGESFELVNFFIVVPCTLDLLRASCSCSWGEFEVFWSLLLFPTPSGAAT